MPREISDNASSILTLLNNINELIVKSSDRKSASEVMRALVVYADSKQYPLNLEKIQNFQKILLDSNPYTLTSLIKSIAEDIMTYDTKSSRRKK